MGAATLRKRDKQILLVTGLYLVAALIAASSPDAVAFSSFLVIPFLILYPAPTLFFYLMLFTTSYFLAGRRSRKVGTIVGLVLVAAAAVGLPALVNLRIGQERRDLLNSDIPLAHPVSPPAFVGLVSATGSGRGCGEICLTLLYSGSAAGVAEAATVEELEGPGPVLMWRIERRDHSCSLPKNKGDEGIDWDRPSTGNAYGRALLGECVVASRARLGPGSLILAHEKLAGLAERMSLWRVTADGRAAPLARKTWNAPKPLFVPLFLSIEGSPNSGAYWTFTRAPHPPAKPGRLDEFVAADALVVPAANPAALRAALDAWLDRPGLQDPAIERELKVAVLNLMTGSTREPEDFGRYVKLIAGPRLDLEVVMRAIDAFPERAVEISDVALARVASLPPDSGDIYWMNFTIDRFPAGTFAHPTAGMLAVLRSPERRRRMPRLVARLAEGGAEAGPMLLDLFRRAVDGEGNGGEPDINTVRATLDGLCRLGPKAAPAYRMVEEGVRSHPRLNEAFGQTAWWAAVRVRLGRPAETIAPPPGAWEGWPVEYHERLEKVHCSPP